MRESDEGAAERYANLSEEAKIALIMRSSGAGTTDTSPTVSAPGARQVLVIAITIIVVVVCLMAIWFAYAHLTAFVPR